jgi:hypothetical protein
MHPIATTKNWSHHLHDGMLSMWHHIDQHLRSRHFWAGVGITLLIVGFVAMLLFLAKNAPINAPIDSPSSMPYSPYQF